MCAPIMLNFPFCKRKLVFDLFQTCTKLMFGLSDVFVVPVLARDRINGVGLLFFRDRILRFGENMPQSLKRFLSNFSVVAIQNSRDGFRNTLYIRNKSKFAGIFDSVISIPNNRRQNSRKITRNCISRRINKRGNGSQRNSRFMNFR